MFTIAMSSILKLLFITAFINIGLVVTQSASKLPLYDHLDLVKSLPNYTGDYSKIGHYSGYLQADERTYLYYWFFQSKSANWTADPVVLWLNGGPGGSSLIGAVSRMGQIWLSNGTLIRNPTDFDRSKKANMLYIETPAYVGFSYQDFPADQQFNDSQTAKHNFGAIKDFYNKFPLLVDNDFYLSGVSYASKFNLPLADALVKNEYPKNFKGVFISSGVFNRSDKYTSKMLHAHTLGLVDPFEWTQLTDACCPKAFCSLRECPIYEKADSCFYAYSYIYTNLMDHPIDIYNIYRKPINITSRWTNWLQNEAVKEALQIRNFSKEWLLTSDNKYDQDILVVSDLVRKLLESGIHVLILNGDGDLITSYIEAKWLVEDLRAEPKLITELKSNAPWVRDGKVVGHKQQYLVRTNRRAVATELTFVVLYGSGHSESDQPELVYELFSNFI